MSKLIDGKYTMGMPFTTGNQYITSDEVIESDTHQTLSHALNTLQGGTFANGTFTGHLTFGDAVGDNITIHAGTTTYESNASITLKDNSSGAMTVSSTGNTNMMVVNTTNGSETITLNKKLELINTENGGSMMNIQTNNTAWSFENFYGILLMRPSMGTIFTITSSDYNNSCLYISAADYAPMMEVMDSVNSILRLGDTTFGATSIMEINGLSPVIKSTVDSTSITDTNCFNCLGGMTIRKKLYVGTGLYLPTTGGTASELNYYEEALSIAATFQSSGGGGTTQGATLFLTRIGNMCFLFCPTIRINANGSQIITSSAVIPTRFRPLSEQTNHIHSVDIGSFLDIGGLVVKVDGYLRIYKSNGSVNFAVGLNSGTTEGDTWSWMIK